MLLLAATACWQGPPAPEGNRTPFIATSSAILQSNGNTMQTLPNGLTLIHRESTANAIVGLTVAIDMGAAQEPPEKAGQTNLMMRLLPKGTKTRTAEAIAARLADLGASLTPAAGYDVCTLSLQCLDEDLDEAFELMADVLLNPVFPAAELRLEREKVLAGIRRTEDQPGAFASREFRRAVYGGHAYGTPLEGTPETLEGITAIDLGAAHREAFVPSNMVVAVVGRVPRERIEALATQHLGALALERKPRYIADKVIAPGGSIREFPRPSQQGFVVIGNLTCPVGDRDQAPLEVAATILGGGMSSRLFAELRDRRGLAYAVGAGAGFQRHQGVFSVYIGTNAETIEKWFPRGGTAEINPALRNGLWQEVDILRREPVTEEELERARNYIAGNMLRARERHLAQASALAWMQVSGLGIDHEDRLLAAIRAVTARDVMRVANKYFLDPTVVVVRPAAP